MKSEEKTQILDLVGKAKIPEALEKLKAVCQSEDQVAQVLQIQVMYSKNEDDYRRGIIKDDIYRPEFSRINMMLVYTINQIDEEQREGVFLNKQTAILKYNQQYARFAQKRFKSLLVIGLSTLLMSLIIIVILRTPVLANIESVVYRVLLTICGGLFVYHLPFLVRYFQNIGSQNRLILTFAAVAGLYFINLPSCLRKSYSDINPPLGMYLSFGYYENFLRPVAETLQKNNPSDIKIKRHSNSVGDSFVLKDYRLYVLVPNVVDLEMKNQISDYIKSHSLDTVMVSVVNRTMPLYGKNINGVYCFFDFPTTLVTLLKYVDVTSGSYCDFECKKGIVAPEIQNFKAKLGEFILSSEYLSGKIHITDFNNQTSPIPGM